MISIILIKNFRSSSCQQFFLLIRWCPNLFQPSFLEFNYSINPYILFLVSGFSINYSKPTFLYCSIVSKSSVLDNITHTICILNLLWMSWLLFYKSRPFPLSNTWSINMIVNGCILDVAYCEYIFNITLFKSDSVAKQFNLISSLEQINVCIDNIFTSSSILT